MAESYCFFQPGSDGLTGHTQLIGDGRPLDKAITAIMVFAQSKKLQSADWFLADHLTECSLYP